VSHALRFTRPLRRQVAELRARKKFDGVPVEQVRQYWDNRPCNIRHSSRPVGTVEYFTEVEQRKYFVEPHIPGFADFSRWKGLRVLEIGCGIGTDTVNFARAGADVVACDLSTSSIDLARRRAELFGVADRIRFVATDAETMTQVPASPPFDLVYSFGVVHHTPHPRRVLAEARKRQAPGGQLKLMVYNRCSWKVIGLALRLGWRYPFDLRRAVADHSEAQEGCPVTFVYTRREVTRLLESVGYRVDKVRVDHIFPYRVRDYVEHRYVRRFPFNVLPRPLTRALERSLGWHMLIDATSV
jgi:2-polyprenyl-3-methyl-5-hydroxy-6-metoxy-1,4-benzoquinol methylase